MKPTWSVRFPRSSGPSGPSPGRWWLLALACSVGCAAPQVRLNAPEELHRVELGRLVLESPFALAPDAPVLEQLGQLQRELAATLQLPPPERAIQVRLFGSQEQLDAFRQLRYLGLPARRAFFVEEAGRLQVYAAWGPRVVEDLRHEVVHGWLHAAAPRVPLWLDEGLAEYFEVPPSPSRINATHCQLLLGRMALGWQPDLARLQRLNSPLEITQQDYAECWAWVHFLLHSRPQRAELLRAYLRRCRHAQTPEPLAALWSRREPWPQVQAQLRAHLVRLGATRSRSPR